MSRRYTGPTPETVAKLLERERYSCLRCGEELAGARGLDWVCHHRRPRALGGSRQADTNSPANLILLCSWCHRHIERHRAEALRNGWLVPQGLDPAAVALLVEQESRWSYLYLTDSAEYSLHPPEVAA